MRSFVIIAIQSFGCNIYKHGRNYSAGEYSYRRRVPALAGQQGDGVIVAVLDDVRI